MYFRTTSCPVWAAFYMLAVITRPLCFVGAFTLSKGTRQNIRPFSTQVFSTRNNGGQNDHKQRQQRSDRFSDGLAPRKSRAKKQNRGNNGQRKSQPRRMGDFSDRKSEVSFQQQQGELQTDQVMRDTSRRMTQRFECEHFAECPGCVVKSQVARLPIVESAKLYFSSTAVRSRRIDTIGRDSGGYADGDDFFKVVIPSSITGWRTQAKLAVAARSSAWARDGCIFGLYKKGTHDAMEIPSCSVHHESINRAVAALSAATAKVRTVAYKEDSIESGLRYVQLQVERKTGKICLTLVWKAETLKGTQPSLSRLIKELKKREPNLWHSIWCHCNDTYGNVIFSRKAGRWHAMLGPEFMKEPLPSGGKGFLYFSPLAFRQGNMDGFDVIARQVARAVPGKSKVCELYAGVGVLGLTALDYHAQQGEPLTWLRCSDENAANRRCFDRAVYSMPSEVTGKNAGRRSSKRNHGNDDDDRDSGQMTIKELMEKMMQQQNQPDMLDESEPRQKTSYQVATASTALYEGQALGADVLIVDPPRKGLEEEVLNQLSKRHNHQQDYAENKDFLLTPYHAVNWVNDVSTLIYISCGFDALARDTERLLSSASGWMLESATGYVLFPGSNHLETVAIFKRKIE